MRRCAQKFEGTPEKVINLFSFIAEDVRGILASLGFRTLKEIIGRTDLLHQVSRGADYLDDLDLNPILAQADPGPHARYCTREGRNEVPETLDAQMIDDAAAVLRRTAKRCSCSTTSATRTAPSAPNSRRRSSRKYGKVEARSRTMSPCGCAARPASRSAPSRCRA